MERFLKVSLKIEQVPGGRAIELSMSEVAQLKRILDELARSDKETLKDETPTAYRRRTQ